MPIHRALAAKACCRFAGRRRLASRTKGKKGHTLEDALEDLGKRYESSGKKG